MLGWKTHAILLLLSRVHGLSVGVQAGILCKTTEAQPSGLDAPSVGVCRAQ